MTMMLISSFLFLDSIRKMQLHQSYGTGFIPYNLGWLVLILRVRPDRDTDGQKNETKAD